MAARFGTGHWREDVKSSARSDSAVLVTPATCLLRRPRVFPVPAYRLVLRVESVSKYQLVIRPGLPWHQGTPRAAVIARMKFSLAERVPFGLLIFRTGLSLHHCHSLTATVKACERAARYRTTVAFACPW